VAVDLSRAIGLGLTVHADSERLLGADHPDTLTSRNNLAGAYQSAGRLREAIGLYERNLADRERLLGADHPDTLTSRDNLASAYQPAGRLRKAFTLFRANANVAKHALEVGHPYRQRFLRSFWWALFLPVLSVGLGLLILGSTWLVLAGDHQAAINFWLLLAIVVLALLISRAFRRLLAARDWKFLSVPWFEQVRFSVIWASRQRIRRR
jgi:tetratricopeptide (TPR) repeat protein